MSAEIFAFVQAQVNIQQAGTIVAQTNEDSQTQPGLFEAFMAGYTEDAEILTQPVVDVPQLFTFNNNAFLPPMLDDFTETPEYLCDELENLFTLIKESFDSNPIEQSEIFGESTDEINQVIAQLLNDNDSDLPAKLESFPVDTQQEVHALINEIANELERPTPELNKHVTKLIAALTENHVIETEPESKPVPEIESEDEEEPENAENIDIDTSIAGAAGVIVQSSEINHDTNESKQVSKHVARNIQPENNNVQQESRPEPESVKPEIKFSDALENRTEHSESQDQQNFNDNQDDNENPNQNQNFTRSRNNNNNVRRVTADTGTDTSRTNGTNSRRTESHSSFQNFFDGVINNQRNVTQASPLNLRGQVNFSQSETLREGLVNVVRFIRADGVHKANVVIDPPALGRISVELTSSSSGVEASIKVASEQIRQLVQDQLSQLRMNLSQQGVQVAEFTVDVQQDNQQGGQNSQYQDENQNQRHTGITGGVEDDDTEEFRVDLNEGLLYWVA